MRSDPLRSLDARSYVKLIETEETLKFSSCHTASEQGTHVLRGHCLGQLKVWGLLPGLKLLRTFPTPHSPPNPTFQRLWPKLPLLVVMGKTLCFRNLLQASDFSHLRSATARPSPARACPTHTTNLCEFSALLFLGNVCIPDTQLSAQGFSRLRIFHIAEQGLGLAGGL